MNLSTVQNVQDTEGDCRKENSEDLGVKGLRIINVDGDNPHSPEGRNEHEAATTQLKMSLRDI